MNWVTRWRDDTGSMPAAILLSVIGVGFSTLLAASTVAQIGETRQLDDSTQSLTAAQAGIDTALAHIRAAADDPGADKPIGRLADLPCEFTGRVSTGDPANYRVRVRYLTADPLGLSNSTLLNRTDPSVLAGCPPATSPSFAALLSDGTANTVTGTDWSDVAHRTVRATYTFRGLDDRTPGGQIHVFKPLGGADVCLDAGSAEPAPGTRLRVQQCDATRQAQVFLYNTSLNLVLKSSRTAARPLGMCLDAGPYRYYLTEYVELEPCASAVSRRQQWSIGDYLNFVGTTTSGDQSADCFNVRAPGGPGSYVAVGRQCGGPEYDAVQSFTIDRTAGIGMAGPLTSQVVNFAQYGRCLDLTGLDVNAPYVMVWPCKQHANGDVNWNQQFAVPAVPNPPAGVTASIRIIPESPNPYAGIAHCLTSPLAPGAGYVRVGRCPWGSPPTNMRWTRYVETDDPTTSYTIRDAVGNCLSPTDPKAVPPDLHPLGDTISKTVVASCDGSELQKWNAPPVLDEPRPLKDVGEGFAG